MRLIYTLVCALLLAPYVSFAACGGTTSVDGNNYTAYDASQECVALAVSDAETGGYGKTVIIPACAIDGCVWTTSVTITKNMKVQGAGVTSTYLTVGFTNNSVNDAFFKFIPDATARSNIDSLGDTSTFEVTGIHFYSTTRLTNKFGIWVSNSNTPVIKRVRIYGNSFTKIHRGVQIYGYVQGLIDSNTFVASNATYPENVDSGNPDGWWTNDLRTFGGAEAIYIEDNTFEATAADNSSMSGGNSKGQSVVMRYNTLTSSGSGTSLYWETHSPISQGTIVYGNNITATAAQAPQLRSGKGLFFYNKLQSDIIRVRQEYADQYWTNLVYVQIGGTVCPTVSYFPYKGSWASGREYTAGDIYYYNTGSCSARNCRFVALQNHTSAAGNAPPAAEYWGIAKDNLASVTGYIGYGGTSPQICNDALDVGDDCSCYKVNHTYAFNNRLTSGTLSVLAKGDESYDDSMQTDVGLTNTGVDGAPNPELVENREFFNHNVSYNGTTERGVYCGASLPAACTTGDGAWIPTDLDTMPCSSVSANNIGASPSVPITGTLYRCTATDTWTAWYQPYSYPHPLRGGTSYTQTPNSGTGFSFSPSDAQVVNSGATQIFSLTCSYGYKCSVSGCGGTPATQSRAGTISYTTAAASENCAVTGVAAKTQMEGIGTGTGSLTIGGTGTMTLGN